MLNIAPVREIMAFLNIATIQSFQSTSVSLQILSHHSQLLSLPVHANTATTNYSCCTTLSFDRNIVFVNKTSVLQIHPQLTLT
jgi:hypothetical protein